MARVTISKLNEKFGKNIKGVTEEALEAMAEYDWPGNVRELQNVIESCYAIPGLEAIDVKQIRTQNLVDQKQPDSGEDVMRLSDAKKKLILEALAKTGNNKLKAAKMLGIHRSVLYKMLERHGIT